METIERRKKTALADLNSQASRLRREIAAIHVKIEFYASDCSDGVEAYKREMAPHIAKAEAALREVEVLIADIEATPVQLVLF